MTPQRLTPYEAICSVYARFVEQKINTDELGIVLSKKAPLEEWREAAKRFSLEHPEITITITQP